MLTCSFRNLARSLFIVRLFPSLPAQQTPSVETCLRRSPQIPYLHSQSTPSLAYHSGDVKGLDDDIGRPADKRLVGLSRHRPISLIIVILFHRIRSAMSKSLNIIMHQHLLLLPPLTSRPTSPFRTTSMHVSLPLHIS